MIAYIKSFAIGVGALCAAMSLTASAADLPTKKDVVAAVAPEPAQLGFFVKLGFTYAFNQSDSRLFSAVAPFGPVFEIPGINAKVQNVATVGFESGYMLTPNFSIDVSGGIPMYAKVTTKGAFLTPFGIVPSGTTLSTVMPAFVPITAVYHFSGMGAFQPYMGLGVAPVFSFAQKNGLNTGVRVHPSMGVVLQSGIDYMIDSHWGVSFDVKKVFAHVRTTASGTNFGAVFPGKPSLPIPGKLETDFSPWILSTGVVYKF